MTRQVLALAGLLAVLLLAVERADAGTTRIVFRDIGFPMQYNEAIVRSWLRHHGPGWTRAFVHSFWAQIMAESSGRKDAESSAGGVGLAQLIREAAEDCRVRAGMRGSRRHVRFALGCSAWISKRSRRFWKAPRPERCRRTLTLAGYVSGDGNPHCAQIAARADGHAAVCWEDGISLYMPACVGAGAVHEARNYVDMVGRIERQVRP